MKRFSVWLLVLIYVVSMFALAMPALAAPDTFTVTAQVPEDWTDIYLYVWDDSYNALSEWPGTPMSKTSDGRYALDVPTGYNNVIVNHGGIYQTQDMVGDGMSDIWVVVYGSYDGAVFFEDPEHNPSPIPPISDPDPLTSMALVGEGNSALNWDPADAGCAMTEFSEGMYTKELTMYHGETIQFKLCGNGSWDSGYNFGGEFYADIITAEIPFFLVEGYDSQNLVYTATQDCTLTVTADMTGTAYSVTVTETPFALPEKVYVKIFVSVPEGITPNMWAWGDTGNAFPTWPGETMTREGDWWVVEIPEDCHSVIVNDGTYQTADLSITAGSQNWIVVSEDWSAEVYSFEPIPEPEPTIPTTPGSGSSEPQDSLNGSINSTIREPEKAGSTLGGLVLVLIIGAAVLVGLVVIAVVVIVIIIVVVSKKKKKKAALSAEGDSLVESVIAEESAP